MEELLKAIGAGTISGAIIVVAGYLLRGAIGAALSRSVSRDLELLRADLGAKLEVMKAQLEREALKATLVTTRRHECYEKLLKHLRHAQGAIGVIVRVSKLNPAQSSVFGSPEPAWTAKAEDVEKASHLALAAFQLATEDALNYSDQLRERVTRATGDMLDFVKSVRETPFPTQGQRYGLNHQAQSIAAQVNEIQAKMLEELRPLDTEQAAKRITNAGAS